MKNFSDFKKQILSDPEIKKEYDNLKLEYSFLQELIHKRQKEGLSQQDLAVRIGTNQSAIARLESGRYNPSIQFLRKVAHALGAQLQISLK